MIRKRNTTISSGPGGRRPVGLRSSNTPADRYAAGGSAKEYTKTLDAVLQLDFDTVVPGHGTVGTKQELRTFRESAVLCGTGSTK